MTAHAILAQDVTVLLERLLLSEFSRDLSAAISRDLLDSAIRHVGELLRAKDELLASDIYQLKLRLAIHFAPAEAISYDPTNPIPRHQLIRRFLKDEFNREGQGIDRLARDIATVLDRWDISRRRVSDLVDILRERQNNRCAHCGYRFNSSSMIGRSIDLYKPYHESPDELTSPEVDHKEAVSGIGSNEIENLHAICRLCNQGKGEGLGIDIRREVTYAARPLENIPSADRIRMLYYVIERDGRRCSVTGATCEANELSIRKVRQNGGFVRTNLQTVSVDPLPQDL